MKDYPAGLGVWLLDGPFLALLAAVALILSFLGGVGYGRRALAREIDEGRAAVRRAINVETTERIAALVPGQREATR